MTGRKLTAGVRNGQLLKNECAVLSCLKISVTNAL